MLHNPVAFSLILLLAAAALGKRRTLSRLCFWTAVAVLLICGNEWVVAGLAGRLESRYRSPEPVPRADCIVLLGGGTRDRLAPRPTVEINEAGNRIIYAAHLYRQGKAARILCSGAGPGDDPGSRSEAEDMAELLEMLGVPKEAILVETRARDTHQHATNIHPLLQAREFKHVLLVTSAMHMPRSMGVFKRFCPEIEFIAAPTDFRAAKQISVPWQHKLTALIPTPHNLLECSEVMHEYLGIAYYKLRGWL